MKIDTEGRKELFRARTGSWNYNLNDENSDEDWKVFVLPTFDDLYDGKTYSSPTNTSEDLDYSVKDIRFFGKQVQKANITFLELLYSDKVIINPDLDWYTKELIYGIFEMRDRLVRVNLPKMYEACIGMYKQRIKALGKGSVSTKHLIEKYGYCTKNGMHAYRYLDFLFRFIAYDDFEKALKYGEDSREKMLSIKRGVFTESELTNRLNECHKTMENKFKGRYKNQAEDLETMEELNNIIKEIVKANWR